MATHLSSWQTPIFSNISNISNIFQYYIIKWSKKCVWRPLTSHLGKLHLKLCFLDQRSNNYPSCCPALKRLKRTISNHQWFFQEWFSLWRMMIFQYLVRVWFQDINDYFKNDFHFEGWWFSNYLLVYDYLASLVTKDDRNSWTLKQNQMLSWFYHNIMIFCDN